MKRKSEVERSILEYIRDIEEIRKRIEKKVEVAREYMRKFGTLRS